MSIFPSCLLPVVGVVVHRLLVNVSPVTYFRQIYKYTRSIKRAARMWKSSSAHWPLVRHKWGGSHVFEQFTGRHFKFKDSIALEQSAVFNYYSLHQLRNVTLYRSFFLLSFFSLYSFLKIFHQATSSIIESKWFLAVGVWKVRCLSSAGPDWLITSVCHSLATR